MLTWKKSYESNPLFIAVSLLLLLIIQLEFTLIEGGATFLNPTLALSITFGWVFGKKTYLPIVLTLFIGHFAMRFFVYEFTLSQSIFVALFLSTLTIVQVELALRLANKFNLEKLENIFKPRNLITFLLSVFLVALIGAYFGNITLILSNIVSCNFYRCFSVYLFGDFMAIVLFTPSMILAYKHDPEVFDTFRLRPFIHKGLFALGFFILAHLIALEFSVLDFDRHKYLILIFYIPIGFLFNYRMIHYFTLAFLLISETFYIELLPIIDQTNTFISVIVFLSFATIITLAIKRFYDLRIRQYIDIKEKNRLLNLLLDEVYNLLRLSSDIIDSKDHLEKDYFVRTFRIAYSLFKDMDAGFAYQVKEGIIELITQDVYDKAMIPYVYETQALVDDDQEAILIYDDFKQTLKNRYGDGFDILDEGVYPLKSRIVIALHYQKNESFIMVLDRFKENSISQIQVERLRYFANLLDGLYKRNFFVLRNTSLKDEVVLSIIRTLELYDPYTKGHSEDVAALSLALGEALNLDDKALDELYFAAILHDIGKVGVESHIINKPSRLTKEEYEAVKAHVHYGSEVLDNAESLKPISKIVKHHHEWYNGQGYPSGLSKEAIPLASRIISVADMVSTMATDRPYRPHQTTETILNELSKYQGTQFDPELVKIMIELIENGLLKKQFSLTH